MSAPQSYEKSKRLLLGYTEKMEEVTEEKYGKEVLEAYHKKNNGPSATPGTADATSTPAATSMPKIKTELANETPRSKKRNIKNSHDTWRDFLAGLQLTNKDYEKLSTEIRAKMALTARPSVEHLKSMTRYKRVRGSRGHTWEAQGWLDFLAEHSPDEPVYKGPIPEDVSDTETVFSETTTKLLEDARISWECEGMTGMEFMKTIMSDKEIEQWMMMYENICMLCTEPETAGREDREN